MRGRGLLQAVAAVGPGLVLPPHCLHLVLAEPVAPVAHGSQLHLLLHRQAVHGSLHRDPCTRDEQGRADSRRCVSTVCVHAAHMPEKTREQCGWLRARCTPRHRIVHALKFPVLPLPYLATRPPHASARTLLF